MRTKPLTIFDLMVPGIAVALTALLVWHGPALVHIVLLPGLGLYRWVIVAGELASVGMLCWLWRHSIRLFLYAREQRRRTQTQDESMV